MSVYLTLSNEISDDSWKKSIPLINGLGTEGIGSVFQYHILMNFFSDFIGMDFTYPGSENLSHHSYTGYGEEKFHQNIDTFFNFPHVENNWDEIYDYEGQIDDGFFKLIDEYKKSNNKILVNLYHCHRAVDSFCRNNIESIFTKDRVDRMRNNLVFEGERYFNEGLNVSWHMRTPNPNDIPAEIVSPYREYYVKERDFGRYTNLANALKEKNKDKKITLHIHSQGFSTDFTEFFIFKDENFDVQLHIDDHPISDIYHMSNADIFIMSNSAFSYIPCLLNSNRKITRDNYHTWTFNSIKTNYDFTTFTETLL
tara:strand:+ start:231 stop:1163 length:933 start_codon:yes stop_codon:yes gene_type:complete